MERRVDDDLRTEDLVGWYEGSVNHAHETKQEWVNIMNSEAHLCRVSTQAKVCVISDGRFTTA